MKPVLCLKAAGSGDPKCTWKGLPTLKTPDTRGIRQSLMDTSKLSSVAIHRPVFLQKYVSSEISI